MRHSESGNSLPPFPGNTTTTLQAPRQPTQVHGCLVPMRHMNGTKEDRHCSEPGTRTPSSDFHLQKIQVKVIMEKVTTVQRETEAGAGGSRVSVGQEKAQSLRLHHHQQAEFKGSVGRTSGQK